VSKHIPTAHEVETYSGAFVDTSAPDPATIKIADIAHALSNVCRYGGHCQRFYSVAEHAVFVSHRVERKHNKFWALVALHHDDSEAYLGDIPRPMKPLLGDAYVELTEAMDDAVIEALELPFFAHDFHAPAVKDADNFALFVEARHLLPSQGRQWFGGGQGSDQWELGDSIPQRIITPDYWQDGLAPAEAAKLFLERHKELTEVEA
jgi:5'-deoxynucleotidase YfbR-like HD superfamily hydrolase